MALLFLESIALVKCHAQELGTTWEKADSVHGGRDVMIKPAYAVVGTLLLAIMLMLALIPLIVSAQSVDVPTVPGSPRTVTFHCPFSPTRDVLAALFEQVHLPVKIDKAVSGKVDIQVDNVPFDMVIQDLLDSNTPPLAATSKDGVCYISVQDANQLKAHQKDFVSPDGAVHVQANLTIDWPPPFEGISHPVTRTLLNGNVSVRPLKAGTEISAQAENAGDCLDLLEDTAHGPIILGTMRFDVSSETVKMIGGATVLRDQGGRTLTLYPSL